MPEIDNTDIKILKLLQKDATITVADIAKKIGLTQTPCWRRIQRLEQIGIIDRRVTILNHNMLDLPIVVYVFITTDSHQQKWLDQFAATMREIPEIVELYRLSGEIDYILKLRVRDIAHYDDIYKKIISRITIKSVTSSFAMEEIKFTNILPFDHIQREEKKNEN